MSTFARWVSTPENRSALVAVQRVADGVCRWDTSPKRQRRDTSPKRQRGDTSQHGDHTEQREANPLFLHGPAGTGKTHLVAALADRLIRQCPDVTCTLLPAAEFAERIRHSQEQESQDVTPDWHSDLLAVEDLQHLPVWAAEALIGVLDDRTGRRQQTVITATVGPGQLTRLPARLTSRLAAGLVVGLEPLSPSSRLALLQDKAARRQLALGPDVLAWLAEHAGGSGRQIEGALARVEALTRLNGRVPDVRTVTEHFAAEADLARPTVERIAERVSTYFQVAPREIVSRRRLRNALLPRQVGMYLARRLTPLSLEQIGTYFGGRDHSTVLHACRKVEEALVQDAALSGAVRRLQADLL